jgi:hypothetical protein
MCRSHLNRGFRAGIRPKGVLRPVGLVEHKICTGADARHRALAPRDRLPENSNCPFNARRLSMEPVDLTRARSEQAAVSVQYIATNRWRFTSSGQDPCVRCYSDLIGWHGSCNSAMQHASLCKPTQEVVTISAPIICHAIVSYSAARM